MPRGYLPSTLARLREQWSSGEVIGEPVVAEADDEDTEYVALMTAADLSAALLDGPGRRVVVAVDLSEAEAAADGPVRVPRSRVASVHADPEDRPVDADPDDDLGWWATQEVESALLPG